MKSYKLKFFSVLIILIVPVILLSLSVGLGGIAYADENNYVYLGGTPIGIDAKSEYMTVSDIVEVVTYDGAYSPAYDVGIRKGDIIITANGNRVMDAAELNDIVQGANEVTLSVKRGKKLIDMTVKPAIDIVLNEKKLGLNVKNDVIGIGTLTYITKDGQYGALGHELNDEYNHGSIYQNGNIYDCEITGYNVATDEEAGQLRGKVLFDKPLGTINKNNLCGIFGYYDGIINTSIPLGNKSEVTPGKAKIYTTIDGKNPSYYDIEIIKAIKQNEISDKSMVIRVTDKELRKTTGGILQGMSGSPIIQNGKLIGAVTHVFTVDSTKGYGVYIDWMLAS